MRVLIGQTDAKLRTGYGMLAQAGDMDLRKYAYSHRPESKPTPADDDPAKAGFVDAYLAELKARRAS